MRSMPKLLEISVLNTCIRLQYKVTGNKDSQQFLKHLTYCYDTRIGNNNLTEGGDFVCMYG